MSETSRTTPDGNAARPDPSGGVGGGPMLLGVCGKHRSYREHFEDVAHQPQLIAIKETIYDRGIRAAVDAGVWRDLKRDDPAFTPFGHTMVARRVAGGTSRDWVVGLITTSPDSIGRNEYPLILFASGATSTPMASLERRAARLAALQQEVMAATSLGQIQAAVAAARASPNAAPSNPSTPGTDTTTPTTSGPPPLPSTVAPLVALADDPAIGESRRGLVNALREFHRRFTPTRTLVDRGLHVRVPRTAGTPEAAAVRWMEMLNAELRVSLPTFAFVPNDQPWIDLIIGTPSAADFFCLHASATTLPPVSEIPYQLDPAFVAELNDRIEFARASPAAAIAAANNVARAGDDGQLDRRDGRGWRRWLPWAKD